ncbi:hypothetical protein ABMA27_004159 [Loxostege sticticalis]|uniref:CHK kinase-like domain-containing protein n=1 Tax=Loxostege sticticalis TaxID=481309 RepID=A0ABR3HMM3_LOXSC
MSYIIDIPNTIRDHLKEHIENIAKSEGFLKYKCDVQKKYKNGTNYLGEITEVEIIGETIIGAKEIRIFVKTKPSDGSIIKLLSINDVYSRELYAYKELSETYKQLQEEANVPYEERYTFIKCYEESNIDTIILEDIGKLGYVNWNRLEIISIDFAQKCIKQLAKFHALSFVLEKDKLDYFNCNIKLLKYPFIFNDEYVAFLKNMYETCINHLEGEYKAKLESVLDICEKYYQFVNNSSVIRCLCHGDYRAMNIMMKYNNGEPSDVIPLDYQFIFYGSPVIDILYFIFGSTDSKFRREHLQNLKNLYHETMKEFLEYFKMDINLYYPRKEFDKAYEESLEFGLMVAVWYLPVNLADSDEVLDLNKTSLADASFSANERVKARLEDILDDFTEWGVFKTDTTTDALPDTKCM